MPNTPFCLLHTARQAKACVPGQIYRLETTLFMVCFRAAAYAIVAAGHGGPLLHKAGDGLLQGWADASGDSASAAVLLGKRKVGFLF